MSGHDEDYLISMRSILPRNWVNIDAFHLPSRSAQSTSSPYQAGLHLAPLLYNKSGAFLFSCPGLT